MIRWVKITVYGTVQGVRYREHVKKYADKYKVQGAIRNADDGSVVIYASGPGEALDNLLDYIYQGSCKSEIEEVAIEAMSESEKRRSFRNAFRVIGYE